MVLKTKEQQLINDRCITKAHSSVGNSSQKLGIPKIQFTDHMKLKKKEDQRVDASVLLRSRNKLLAGGNMEKGYEAETEGKAIQRLPHLGIHPINRHPTQTVL